MKKKRPSFMAVLLCLTGLLFLSSLIYFSYSTYQQILRTESDLERSIVPVAEKQKELKKSADIFTSAVENVKEKRKHAEQKKQTAAQEPVQERAPEAENSSNTNQKPSVFSQEDTPNSFSDSSSHIIGIDPGHQSYEIDMSGQESLGPGSSEMKAKASTGTQGSYTQVPEYQLNLDVSLKLQKELEKRGYQVVMTRTDNQTAISNKERAEYATAQGAEIYVRIHANGEDSHTSSGALTMAPSPENPYVSHLSQESSRLSQCILDEYCASTGFSNLGVQYYDNMTGINWSTVPVTILEMGFMTNQQDDRQMNDPAFQDIMVQGIANGIDTYFNSL